MILTTFSTAVALSSSYNYCSQCEKRETMSASLKERHREEVVAKWHQQFWCV